jgi:hypothetical protein
MDLNEEFGDWQYSIGINNEERFDAQNIAPESKEPGAVAVFFRTPQPTLTREAFYPAF